VPIAGQGEDVRLVVNINADSDEETMREWLRGVFADAGKKDVAGALDRKLPRRAIPVFMDMAGIPDGRKCFEATKLERDSLARLFVHMEFIVAGTRPIKDAMVTAGGVSLKEIDPRTMESKKTRGLYICGEMLDIDGPSGGFNLQAAFSTGYTAGDAAAKESDDD